MLRNGFPTTLIFAALSLAANSCASIDNDASEVWTSEDEAAYRQCLQDSMAVATAWEMIERSCREQVNGDNSNGDSF